MYLKSFCIKCHKSFMKELDSESELCPICAEEDIWVITLYYGNKKYYVYYPGDWILINSGGGHVEMIPRESYMKPLDEKTERLREFIGLNFFLKAKKKKIKEFHSSELKKINNLKYGEEHE